MEMFASDELDIRRPTVFRFTETQSDEFRTLNRIGYVVGLKALWDVVIVVFSARVKLKTATIEGRFSKREAQAFHDQIGCEAFARVVRRWLVAALLAKVGLLQFSDILVTRSGRELWHRYDDFRGLSMEHLDVVAKMKWPPIRFMSIQVVWQWMQKIPAFNNDFGVSKAGRALAAFTHLLRRRDPTAVGENLLWALLGLEALYTKGTSELGSQLAAKSQLLLGEQHDFKKAITRMYDYRSRLTHGDLPVPMHYCEYEGLAEYESFLTEVEQQNYVAASVLASSLQALVERDATELNFEWNIVPRLARSGLSAAVDNAAGQVPEAG
jgi:hypothetical protein